MALSVPNGILQFLSPDPLLRCHAEASHFCLAVAADISIVNQLLLGEVYETLPAVDEDLASPLRSHYRPSGLHLASEDNRREGVDCIPTDPVSL